MLDLRAAFSHFLGAEPDRLHFAAHSHHPWPDATRAAQMEAWDTAARLQDGKWSHVLGPLWEDARRRVAAALDLPDPATLCFAPNTHEFVLRILSALPERPRILTTTGEFHSFARQVARLEEEGLVRVTRVPAEPGAEVPARLAEAARAGFDLVWVSQVFFTSGFAVDVGAIAAAAGGDAALVIDGYHGFMALPTSLAPVADRAFYLAGGYKYAMAGEGACFLHAPPGWLPRPRDTGWFAAFGDLSGPQAGAVPFARDGMRFMGATFDPSGLFRLVAALRWLEARGVSVADIHAHAHALQARFVAGLPGTGLDPARLVVPLAEARRGNFLCFDLPDAEDWSARLEARRVVTDRRGSRLRFGFGLYQTAAEVDALLERLG